MDIKDNQIMLLKEDLECVHLYLDTLDMPRVDEKGEQYSIVGRIKQLQNSYLIEMSVIESQYLTGKFNCS